MISGSNNTDSEGAASILIFWVVLFKPLIRLIWKIHVIEHISRIADKNFPAVGQLQRVGATIEDAESEGSLQRLMRRLNED